MLCPHGDQMKRLSAKRRTLLLRGAALGAAAALLPAPLGDATGGQPRRNPVGGIKAAMVPPVIVSLADYGGVPGARAAALVGAFRQALDDLAGQGGGTLLVPRGIYDFGPCTDAASLVLCRDVHDIAISAYGALFTVTTTANVMPNLFYFFNFQNITIAGASFADAGFHPRPDWRGMVCVGIQADRPSRGFMLVDCYAERVVSLLTSHNNAAKRRLLSNIRVHGEVRNAYYGVNASFISKNVDVDLVCHNVRRAVIASALRNADIRITVSSTPQWPGSNGLIALICGGASVGHVDNVRITLAASGEGNYGSYVHFYHQGDEPGGAIRNVDATVHLDNAARATTLFLFDHEAGFVKASTARVWDAIALHGTIAGDFDGRVIANPSASSAPGTVCLDRNLAQRAHAGHSWWCDAT
ncbi:hypothetical protein RCH14_000583 [Massilia sp. MP_M2]